MKFFWNYNENWNALPLLERHNLSIPLRCKAIRESSEKLSRILKSQRGETSKNAMWFLAAYASASRSPTCLLKAKWRRLPTSTFGTPGACYNINKN